jgi:hypothetical protein
LGRSHSASDSLGIDIDRRFVVATYCAPKSAESPISRHRFWSLAVRSIFSAMS